MCVMWYCSVFMYKIYENIDTFLALAGSDLSEAFFRCCRWLREAVWILQVPQRRECHPAWSPGSWTEASSGLVRHGPLYLQTPARSCLGTNRLTPAGEVRPEHTLLQRRLHTQGWGAAGASPTNQTQINPDHSDLQQLHCVNTEEGHIGWNRHHYAECRHTNQNQNQQKNKLLLKSQDSLVQSSPRLPIVYPLTPLFYVVRPGT